MNRNKFNLFGGVAVPVLMMLHVVVAEASSTATGAIIYNSTLSGEQKIALGVNREGHLNTRIGDITSNASATGLAYKWSDDRWIDATSPGCLCEGWGASGNGHVGRANVAVGGVSGLTVESFESSTANITSVTSIGPADDKVLQVTHEYGPSPEAQHTLFQGLVTVTNVSDKVVENVRYRRVMDWDIHPTEFSEYVSHGGVSASLGAAAAPKLIDACDNGFENPTPFGGCRPIDYSTKNSDFNHSGPRDHGSSFNFQLPDLNCGESISFMIYYGVADTRALALDAIDAVGASIYSLGASRSSRDGITYIFGFKGVSGVRLTTELPPKAGSLPSLTKTQTFNDVFLYGDAAYQSTFLYRKDKQWEGHLKRYSLTKEGAISSSKPVLDAGEKLQQKLPSDRKIWTAANGTLTAAKSNDNFTTSNRAVLKSELYRDSIDTVGDDEADDLINFIRGTDSYDEQGVGKYTEERDWKLADIYHANLTIVPPPSNSDTSSSVKSRAHYKKTRTPTYSSFVTTNENRDAVLYAAANDGMLHAFDVTTMEELWAFVPPPVLDKLRSIYNSKGSDGIKGKTNSVYLVDGTPTIKDIFYGGAWKSVLMAGIGYGGKGYYAIDVTDPESPSHLFSFAHNNDKRVIDYWDSNGTRTTYDYVKETVPDALDYSGLGEAWARPFISLIPYSESQRWVAVLGGGYAGVDGAKAGYGSYIYVIDLEPNTSQGGKLGTVLSKVAVTASSTIDVANGVVAPVSAISVDSASSADYYGSLIYLADLQGRTWKLDLAKDDLKDPDSGLFSIEKHLKAETTLANDRQLFHKPVNDFLSGTPYHFMGTGDMTRLQRRDSTIANRIFAIKDADYPSSAKSSGDTSLPYTISSLKDASKRICPEPSQKGWYQNLSSILSGSSQGAKVTGDAAIYPDNKNVYFTAYVPSSELTCSVDGDSSLVVLTKECGIQEVAAEKLGKGIATTPVIYKGNLYIGVGNRSEKDEFKGGAKNIYRKALTAAEEEEGGTKNYSIESWRERF